MMVDESALVRHTAACWGAHMADDRAADGGLLGNRAQQRLRSPWLSPPATSMLAGTRIT